jgi:quercetin dioxygenase-like cupin family protein
MRLRTLFAGIAVLLLLLVAIPFSGAAADQAATPDAVIPSPTGEVVREIIGTSSPDEAPGEVFELSRYTIPAGAVLPVHVHPGDQMATVISGTLTYHVIANGSVAIVRADGTEEIGEPGDTLTFTVGDSWVEPEGMVHWAQNLTGEPVELLSASLFEAGVPAAEVVEASPEATPAA